MFPRDKTQLEPFQHSQLGECDPVHVPRPSNTRQRQSGDTLNRVRHATTQVPQPSVEAHQHVHTNSVCDMDQNTDNIATTTVFTTVEFRDGTLLLKMTLNWCRTPEHANAGSRTPLNPRGTTAQLATQAPAEAKRQMIPVGTRNHESATHHLGRQDPPRWQDQSGR